MQKQKSKKGGRRGKATTANSWKKIVGLTEVAGAGVVRRLTFTGSATTNAAGIFVVNASTVGMRANSYEWSAISALYQEYRLLAAKISVTAGFPQALIVPSTDLASVVCGTDRSGALTPPTTAPGIFQLDDVKLYNGDYTEKAPIVYSAKAIDLQNQLFTPIGTNATSFILYVGIIGDFSTANIAQYWIEWVAEFKGAQ